MATEKNTPTLVQSFVPILFLIVLLALNVYYFSDNASYGPNQIALLIAAAIGSLFALNLGFSWKNVVDGMVKSISSAMSAILILMMIGALAGTWMLSGIVPAMIYYGLEILNPTIFLFAACIVSSIISLATGSSWSTTATIGIALMGIGKALGIDDGVIAGAVISGAYFGDKMSPLSDTTNLAPAMAGTDLFTHIRYMAFTTAPSYIITIIIFLIWGFSIDGSGSMDSVTQTQQLIAEKFNINLFLFIVPLTVIFMIIKKMPALPAIFIGSILGVVFALIFQPDIIKQIGGSYSLSGGYKASITSMFTEMSFVTGNEAVDKLLTSKGMEGMLNTIWLILCAMIFGGVMEMSGMLKRIATSIIAMAKSTASLVAATAGTCIFFNVTASDQYIAIVVPGRMFKGTFRDRGLAPENLSRTLEDSGTVTSVLIPWNTCGAYQSGVLQVSTFDYFFYSFFNLISPFMTILFAALNIKIRRLTSGEVEEEQETK
ncbi:MAG: Na+/H+ antiporter NhaC [Cyclobacteriaceae bacterium]|nr:Na+/H+ antiporter NhaC [Cyclobacteriaceae bacterium]